LSASGSCCSRAGSATAALYQRSTSAIPKEQVGDLWIAATAIRWELPLVEHDAVFAGCLSLTLITELEIDD
jgi:hypothetical protein